MTISRHLYAIGGIMAVLTAASFGTGHYKAAFAPATSNVLVTNTAAQPVPTQAQGTTQVAGTVGLSTGTKVGINGTVSLDPSTSVNLPYNDASPLSVKTQDTHRIPVHTEYNFAILPQNNTAGFQDMYTVPGGKRLVIEEMYAYVAGDSSNPMSFTEIGVRNNITTKANMPLHLEQDSAAGGTWSTMVQTKFYVDAGDTVFNFERETTTGTSTFVAIGFSGYLEDAP